MRLITSNLEDSNEVVSIGSHRKAVNAVCFDWYKGSYLASVGDDCRYEYIHPLITTISDSSNLICLEFIPAGGCLISK